jgi:hypothetical protein
VAKVAHADTGETRKRPIVPHQRGLRTYIQSTHHINDRIQVNGKCQCLFSLASAAVLRSRHVGRSR